MSKKIWYSQPLSVIWETYNKSNKNGSLSPQEFISERINPLMITATPSTQRQTQSEIFISDMFYADTQKEFLHLFFIDKSLRDFLKGLTIKDFDGLMQTIIENGIDLPFCYRNNFGFISKNKKNEKVFDFGIHIPYENKYKGYAFRFIHHPTDKELLFVWDTGSNFGFINVEEYKNYINDNSEDAKLVTEYFQLAVNTIIYMNTFPDCVVDGVPHNIKEEYSKTITITDKINDIIDTDSKRTVSPHFRRAYFKRLTSDYFTHKKGQTILIKETMVKGKAKTIYTADNLEIMEE